MNRRKLDKTLHKRKLWEEKEKEKPHSTIHNTQKPDENLRYKKTTKKL